MRTNITDVRSIIPATAVMDADVESYIGAANLFTTNWLGSVGLTEDTLTEIERWMTAHMIASTRDRIGIKEEAGSAKIEYANTFAAGLLSTPYGQMVLSLDTTGTLDSLGQKKQIKIKSL